MLRCHRYLAENALSVVFVDGAAADAGAVFFAKEDMEKLSEDDLVRMDFEFEFDGDVANVDTDVAAIVHDDAETALSSAENAEADEPAKFCR